MRQNAQILRLSIYIDEKKPFINCFPFEVHLQLLYSNLHKGYSYMRTFSRASFVPFADHPAQYIIDCYEQWNEQVKGERFLVLFFFPATCTH